jgi:arsenical pump membrane protein
VLHGPAAEAVSCALLGAVLLTAIIRPRGLPESAVAVPAALIVILTGALPLHQAGAGARRLLPVLGFLGAVLVVSHFCQQEGLFTAAGARLARASHGSPVRLLRGVFGLASVTTAVLSLDTTVVLLTPVVHDTAARLRVRPKPHVYACTHLANSASLLLPVSNLTNLLAFSVAGLTLVRFGGLMALPWLAAIAVEYVVFRWFFAADLAAGGQATDGPVPRIPRFALVTVAATLAGFVVTSLAGVNPAWAAFGGACLLAARALARGTETAAGVARAIGIPFLLFVLGLGIVVDAVVRNGLGAAIAHLIPGGSSLPALLAIAGLAALLANLVNNLPAILVLVSVLGGAVAAGPGPVLAALIGVNIGPNLSYAGSLATLLWRRLLADRDHDVDLAEFTRLGLLTVPAGLVLATVALWAALQI